MDRKPSLFTRTKIVCTMGPAVSSYESILALIDAGMNMARLNFSHGTHEEHLQTITYLKRAREETGKPLAIMLDTHGPKVRVGKLPNDAITLKPKQRLKLVSYETKKEDEIYIHPVEVIDALTVGMKVLFDDGYIVSEVVEKKDKVAVLEMQNAGVLKSGKGVNIPGAQIPLPALTEGDIEDLKFGCKHDVDVVAASFIRSAHHVSTIKALLAKEGKPEILVIAKIESTQGVENFDSIVQVADGIMVARGDLGVEVDLSLVPKLQKMMIRKCYQACKPVITATQMLESMITNPRPTRAEVSDVANAIYDSTSCVMLSGETAVGKYPIETVRIMKSIVQEAESDFPYHDFFNRSSQRDYHDVSAAVSMAAVKTAYSANAKSIFAFTASGQTARLVSRLRPSMPIIAVTPSLKHYHQLSFNWGVVPVHAEGCKNAKEAFSKASHFAKEAGFISFGDVVVVTAGVPFGTKGTTNMMMVENIGEVLVRGHKGLGREVTGKVVFVLAPEDCDEEKVAGCIVIIPHCDATFLPLLKKAAGVVLQNHIVDYSSEKYVEVVAKTFGLSCLSRADGALSSLEEGDVVTLDPQKGIIYLADR
jgi:pyruvate kinase